VTFSLEQRPYIFSVFPWSVTVSFRPSVLTKFDYDVRLKTKDIQLTQFIITYPFHLISVFMIEVEEISEITKHF
jgi:hypothetical protein